jgi:hypothetical protein
MIASASRFRLYEQFAEYRQASLARGYGALVRNSSDDESLKLVYPNPRQLHGWYQYLLAHNLGPDPREYERTTQQLLDAAQPKVRLGSWVPRINEYVLVSPSRCSGSLDNVKPIPGQPGLYAVGGWAWDVAAGQRPFSIIIATGAGTIAGSAPLGVPRPDVQKALGYVNDLNTGWSGSMPLPSGAAIHAFAVLADRRSACPLMNEFQTF